MVKKKKKKRSTADSLQFSSHVWGPKLHRVCHSFGLPTELSFQQSLSVFQIYNKRHTWNGESTKKNRWQTICFPKVLKIKTKTKNGIYKFYDSGQQSSFFVILYLLIRTSKTFFRKMFFLVLCESFWFHESVCTAYKCDPCSGVQVFCATLPAFFFLPLHSKLFHSQFESFNSLLVLVGCCSIDLYNVPSFWERERTWSRHLLFSRCCCVFI